MCSLLFIHVCEDQKRFALERCHALRSEKRIQCSSIHYNTNYRYRWISSMRTARFGIDLIRTFFWGMGRLLVGVLETLYFGIYALSDKYWAGGLVLISRMFLLSIYSSYVIQRWFVLRLADWYEYTNSQSACSCWCSVQENMAQGISASLIDK